MKTNNTVLPPQDVPQAKVLLVDSEPHHLQSVLRGLFLFGHECHATPKADEALQILATSPGDDYDILLVDLGTGRAGSDLVSQALSLRPELRVVVLAGLTLPPSIEALRQRGVSILQKPFAPDKLDETIRNARAAEAFGEPPQSIRSRCGG